MPMYMYNNIKVVFFLPVECHPFFQQEKLRAYCKSKGKSFCVCWHFREYIFIILIDTGIAFECYAPLGSPARLGLDPNQPVVMEDPVINEIAAKYNVTPAQV